MSRFACRAASTTRHPVVMMRFVDKANELLSKRTQSDVLFAHFSGLPGRMGISVGEAVVAR